MKTFALSLLLFLGGYSPAEAAVHDRIINACSALLIKWLPKLKYDTEDALARRRRYEFEWVSVHRVFELINPMLPRKSRVFIPPIFIHVLSENEIAEATQAGDDRLRAILALTGFDLESKDSPRFRYAIANASRRVLKSYRDFFREYGVENQTSDRASPD